MGWSWAPFAVMEALARVSVEPGEVWYVLNHTPRWPRPAADDVGLWTLTIWGRTSTGRALLVAVRPLGGRDWEIVGARPLTPEELAEFEHWEADRD